MFNLGEMIQPLLHQKFLLFFLTIILSIDLTLISAQGAEHPGRCVRIFREMNHEIQSGYVTPQTKERVLQFFHDKKIPPEKRAKRIFAQIVSDRLKLLSKKEAKLVRNFLRKNIFQDYQESGSPLFAAFFDQDWPDKKEIVLSLPVDLRDTIIEYTVLTHELEHYIQSLAIARDSSLKKQKATEMLTHFVDIKYEQEVGAMLSEFEYLNSIPLEIKQSIVQTIATQPETFEPDTAEFLLMLLGTQKLTPMEHVQHQHQIGRYDRKSLEQLQDQPLWFGSLAFLAAPTEPMAIETISQHISKIHEVCQQLTEKEKSHSHSLGTKKNLLLLCKKHQQKAEGS